MKLSPARFNAHLAHMGQVVSWRRAFNCPCRNKNSGAATSACPQCHGLGTIWADPVAGVVGVSGEKVQRAWAQYGMWQNGDVVLTIPSNTPVYAAGEFDRVVMSNSSAPFSMTLTRGDGDVLKFPVVTVDRVFWLVNNVIVEGGIPTVSIDGTITWINGTPPGVPTVALAGAGAGALSVGSYTYRLTFVAPTGETEGGTVSLAVAVAAPATDGKIALSAIPLGPVGVTTRKIFRTAANGATHKLVATLYDNVTTTYLDNVADAALGAVAPTAQVQPSGGMQYSITGRKRPEYFMFGDYPQDRAHHSGEALPRRVVLRLFDLFGRGT